MNPSPESQALPRLQLVTRLACIGAGTIAILALLGWVFDLPALRTPLPGSVAMNPVTAFAFLLASISLWIIQSTDPAAPRPLAKLFAAVVAAIGAFKVFSLLAHIDFPLDQLLFHDKLAAMTPPNRMAPNTALAFAILGSGLLALRSPARLARLTASTLILATVSISMAALIGYLYAARNLYGVLSFIPMAVNTACAFLLLSLGALLARPDFELMRLLLSQSPGGALMRRVLPAVVFGPILLGWLRLHGQWRGHFGLEIGTALLILAIIGSFVSLLWLTARSLDRADSVRRQVEAALLESETRLQAVLDHTTVVIYLKDLEGRILLVNRRFEELIGKPRSEIVGRLDSASLTGATLTTFRANDPDVLEAKGPLSFERTVALDDVVRTFVSIKCALRDEAGTPYAICGVATEITERKRAEADTQRLQSFLNSIVENLPIMIFVKNAADLRFVRLNKAAEDLLGYRREELLGKSDYNFFSKEQADFFAAKDREVLASGSLVDIAEEVVSTRAKGQRLLHTRKVPILDAETGEPMFLLGISEDITERREAERKIETLHQEAQSQAEQLQVANRELEAFSYSVSHDLRAPLRHIAGFVDLLLRQNASQLDETGKRRLTAVSESAHKMGQLIDDLLVFSRMGRTELQTAIVDLNAVLQSILGELELDAKGRNIRWVLGQLPKVQGDASMLRLVLANLVGNAVKYTGKRKQPVIEVGATDNGPEGVVVFVKDNGAGFDMEYAGKLFGVFQRLHRQDEFAGTGIGLANVRRIIHRHGGKTWAEGALDKGATFSFSLPTRENKEEERWAA